MALKHAVLGLVIERPGYGYQLAQRVQDRCPSWGWERSGVYGALDRLLSDGRVRSLGERASSDTGRAAPRTVYQATDAGVDYFREWVVRASSPSPIRQELDLKMLLSGPEFLPELIEQTWMQEQQCLEELKALTQAGPGMRAGGRQAPQTWSHLSAMLQRDAEMKLLRVRAEWLQDARHAMKLALEGSSPGSV